VKTQFRHSSKYREQERKLPIWTKLCGSPDISTVPANQCQPQEEPGSRPDLTAWELPVRREDEQWRWFSIFQGGGFQTAKSATFSSVD